MWFWLCKDDCFRAWLSPFFFFGWFRCFSIEYMLKEILLLYMYFEIFFKLMCLIIYRLIEFKL